MSYDQIVGCLPIVAGAVAYVHVVLPRLTARHGAALTAGLAGVLIGAAAFFMTGPGGWLAVLAATALVTGHLAWASGRRSTTPPASTTSERSLQPAAGPLQATTADDAPGPASPAGTERSMLGRYRIERKLGNGAMGAVYLAHDPQIGRQVALKTIALGREFDGPALVDARERFFREAATAGRLQHPDIVTVFDAGEAQDLAYIAMEFVKGDDLLPHTQPGRLLPPKQVAGIVLRVAEALAYAHRQGVVHRDIKPANVMIDPASGSLKVTDFGIARIVDASRTRTGLVLGTPSFMSPEQMAGLRVDGRSDLYSLGVMLFQLLTGALPHASDSMASLMRQIANQPAPDIRTLRPELPEALANIVALALEKRPETRYADGRQLADDLRAVMRLL